MKLPYNRFAARSHTIANSGKRKTMQTMISGTHGGISVAVTLPRMKIGEKRPCVVIIHGLGGAKCLYPLPLISTILSFMGISTIRYDLAGHGHSAGKASEVTLSDHISDAAFVMDFAHRLDFISSYGILGIKQGCLIGLFAANYIVEDLKATVYVDPKSDIPTTLNLDTIPNKYEGPGLILERMQIKRVCDFLKRHTQQTKLVV